MGSITYYNSLEEYRITIVMALFDECMTSSRNTCQNKSEDEELTSWKQAQDIPEIPRRKEVNLDFVDYCEV